MFDYIKLCLMQIGKDILFAIGYVFSAFALLCVLILLVKLGIYSLMWNPFNV